MTDARDQGFQGSTCWPVIASGGVSAIEDIESLRKEAHRGISGAIVGRALYEGSLDLVTAQALADEPA